MAHDGRIGVRVPAEILEKIEELAKQRHISKSDVVLEACLQYFNKPSTEELKEQMRQIIIEDPNILDGALKKVGLRVITDKE